MLLLVLLVLLVLPVLPVVLVLSCVPMIAIKLQSMENLLPKRWVGISSPNVQPDPLVTATKIAGFRYAPALHSQACPSPLPTPTLDTLLAAGHLRAWQ